jgi:hypothetical protein
MSTALNHPGDPQAPDSPPPTPSTSTTPPDLRALFQPLFTEFINVEFAVNKHREIAAWMEKWQERHNSEVNTATAKNTAITPTNKRAPTSAELIKYITLIIDKCAGTLNMIDRTHISAGFMINRSFDTCAAAIADRGRIHKFKTLTKDFEKVSSACGDIWRFHAKNCFEGEFDTSRDFAEHGGLENLRIKELKDVEEQWNVERGGLVAVMEALQGMVHILDGGDD